MLSNYSIYMKKVFISLGVIIGLLVVALFVLPVFFKGDILRFVLKESSKYIRAEVTIEDVSLSMFRSFPDLNVGIRNVVVTGQGEFSGDTIVQVPLFEASVNLKSLLWGNEVVVNRVLLRDAVVSPVVSISGVANWDVLIAGEAVAEQESGGTNEGSGDQGVLFHDIAVEGLQFRYNDYQHSIYARVDGVNLQFSGNFSESNTLVDVVLGLSNISFRQQNSVWVNNTSLRWEAEIGANLREQAFDIRRSDLWVNDLKLDVTGDVVVRGDKYDVDLKLNAPDTKFESLLALVPKDFQRYIEGLKATGDFTLSAKTKGVYYAGHLPAFDVKFSVGNASIQYAGLPESIEGIHLDLNVSNPGGSADSTLLDLKQMSFTIANNPFNMYVKVANLNDPVVDGGAKGVINFMSLKKALPLKDVTLQGVITTDVTFNGKYAYIEREEYEKFTAKGSITLRDILFVSKDFPQGVSISQGDLTVTPSRLNLSNLQARVYSSDFTLKGSVSNYLPYFLKDGVLRGDFSLGSNLLNLNEFMVSVPTDTIQQEAKGASKGALEVPKGINIQLSTNIGMVLFDNLTIRGVKGGVHLADGVATLGDLRMNMLNGTMVLNGRYNSVNPKVPRVDFSFDVSNFDVHEVYNSFSFIKRSIPIAMSCSGRVSSSMKFSATLDQEMSPVMSTANGEGFVFSQGILIRDNPAMNQLAGVLKNEELSRISISSLRVDFKLQDGNIVVAPFKTTLAGNPVTIFGNQSVDGVLDYTLSMNVNRKFFGKDINNLLKAIPGSDHIQTLDVDAKVSGTLTKPVIKPDLSKAIKAVGKEAEKELKSKAKDGILKGLEKLFK